MGIVGPRPETGLRIDLERPVREGPPWRYEGKIVTAAAHFRLQAVVTENGEVTLTEAEPLPDGVAKKARLMLRAAWRHAQDDAAPPPRRIVRWRA
jgi:hypothetical protein